MFRTPPITELCQGEMNDFILEIVQKELRNIPQDTHCRRRELCEAILACNSEVGNRSRMREGLTTILKSWDAKQDQINKLERLGFTVSKGKTHYKLRINNSAYFAVLGGTPGDRRSGNNSTMNALSAFF